MNQNFIVTHITQLIINFWGENAYSKKTRRKKKGKEKEKDLVLAPSLKIIQGNFVLKTPESRVWP